jgi:tetratricopeptide (TPR) repeat protein
VAAVIYGEAKLLERRATLLREAERDIRTLEPFVADQPDVVWAIWHFHEEAGDRRKALEFARRWLEKSGSPGAANYCVIDLYQQEHFKEALACLDQRRRPDALPDLMRAIVLVELDRERVLEEFQKAQRKLPGNELEDWTDILLLLGRREDALAIYRALPDPTSTISIDRHEFEKAKYQFGRGKLSEEGFIATAGEHRWRQSIAHRKIGLFRLAGGDRVAAREHFQKGARYCTGLDPFWCRMFLSRMNKDPGWPSWISPKK